MYWDLGEQIKFYVIRICCFGGRQDKKSEQRVSLKKKDRIKILKVEFSSIIIALLINCYSMYHRQQNKSYRQRSLLPHFEDKHDFSHSEFTCP